MNIFNYDHIQNGSSNDTSIYDKERLTGVSTRQTGLQTSIGCRNLQTQTGCTCLLEFTGRTEL